MSINFTELLPKESSLRSHRFLIRVRYLLLGLCLVTGCSIFSGGKPTISPALSRLVFTNHAVKNSNSLLKQNKAQRFIGKLAWPVRAAKISSRFGPRNGRFHSGLDIRAEKGSAVRAACTGRVEFISENIGEFGTVALVRCAELLTFYAHLDEVNVEQESEVAQGSVIATVGDSGNARGPHLHFETRINSNGRFISIDPALFFPQ